MGLSEDVPLLAAHDLDNFLLPLVTHLSRLTGRRFASVWGTKRHCEQSCLRVEQATPVEWSVSSDRLHRVRTTTSAQSEAFKEQIDSALAGAVALPDGPVALQVGFTVGPTRNWPNLWKPTVDALGRILGRDNPARPWAPRDGRVVELGLHRAVDPSLANDVLIAVGARAV